MRKLLIFTLIAVVLCVKGHAQELKKVKIHDGNILMKVPVSFVEMIPEDINQRFPSVRKPMAAYTDEYRQSEQTVKISATQWGNKDQEIAKSFFKASVMELFDKVEFTREEIVTVKKQTFIIFEFTSYIRGTETKPSERKYNYMLYYIHDYKTLVVSFRCPQSEMGLYKPMAQEIFDTIKIKKI